MSHNLNCSNLFKWLHPSFLSLPTCNLKSGWKKTVVSSWIHCFLTGCVMVSLLSECRSLDCEHCFSRDFCTKCKPGFQLYKGKCLSHCPEGTFAHQTDCLGKWRRCTTTAYHIWRTYIHTIQETLIESYWGATANKYDFLYINLLSCCLLPAMSL